jgi:hypothetical protein
MVSVKSESVSSLTSEGWRIVDDATLGQADASSTMRPVLHGGIRL